MPPVQESAAPTRYPSLSSFYLADERRVSSREEDVGLWWRDGVDGPMHRAAWVQATGELYLVQLGAPQDGGGQVEVLGVADHERLLVALDGWREECGTPDSLPWLREHAARLRQRVRAAHLKLAAVAGAGATFASALAIATDLA